MITVGVVEQGRTRELRRSVLRPELGPGDPLPGDELSTDVHLGAAGADGTVVCTCFVYPRPCPWLPGRCGAWQLRQMATRPDRRGRGLGGRVLDAATRYVRDAGGRLLWCHARVSAAGLYARHGFDVHGADFLDERGVPHRHMWLELSGPATSSTR